MINAGTWVEIKSIVLRAGNRAPQVPQETQQVDLELRARGFLQESAVLGSSVRIETLAGRIIEGVLETAEPGWFHSFGSNHPELLKVGSICRKTLESGGAS
jgi:hypothetical protein